MIKIQIKDAFVSIKNGANINQNKDSSGIPITRIETIVDYQIDIKKLGYANILDESYQDYYLREGDILMSHINSVSHLGKVALFDNLNTKIIHGMNLLCLRANQGKIFPKYAYYYFRSPIFLNSLKKITKKSVNQASINISNLEKLTILIPENPADQIRIAEVLTKTEILIQQRKESIDLLTSFLRSTFLDMFGDPVKNEKKWDKLKLKDIVKIGTGSTPSRSKENEYYKGNIFWVKTTEVKGEYIQTTSEKITELAIKETNCKVYPLNTILLAMYGHGKTRGNVGLLKVEASTNQACATIQPSKKINQVYLYEYLKISYLELRKLARGGNQENLNLNIVGNFEVFNPPIKLQNKFASIVEKAEKVKEQYKESLKELENLFGSLSQKAFKGELDLSKLDVSAQIREIEKKIEVESGLDISLETKLSKSMQMFIKQTADIQKRLALSNNVIPKALYEQIEAINKSIEPFQNLNKIPEQLASAMKSFDGIKSITSQLSQDAKEKFKAKLTWEDVNFEMVANWIKDEYSEYHFNSEILMHFLENERVTFCNYHSSEELKTNPKLNEADDIKSFVFLALKGKNQFIKLEQFFYDAVSENVPLKLRNDDYKVIKDKEKELRSGIYFKVVE